MESHTTEKAYIPDRLEEDDEFEDFEEQEFVRKVDLGLDPIQWEDNWDDEQINDDFCTQLRKELKQ